MKNEIFEIGKSVLLSSAGNRKSIYKSEIFSECKTDREKKSMRIRLRRERDKYLSAFLQYQKNPTKLSELKKVWKEYANKVYTDINIICDNNTASESIELIKKFVAFMEK